MTLEEWKKEARKRFGSNTFDWMFVCPQCGAAQDVRACFNARMPIEKIAVSCIGGYVSLHRPDGQPLIGCLYAPSELFGMNSVAIEGRPNVFEFLKVASDS